MPIQPVNRPEDACRASGMVPSALNEGGGASTEPTRTPSPELDWVQVSEGESPRLKTPEESNPLNTAPFDAIALTHALNGLASAKERGCASVIPSGGVQDEREIPMTPNNSWFQHHPAPPLVIGSDLFHPDPTDSSPKRVKSRSSKKPKNKRSKNRKKSSPPSNTYDANASKAPMREVRSSLDVLSKHIRSATSTSVFECAYSPTISIEATTQIELSEPNAAQGVANNHEEKPEVTDSEWIKLTESASRDEITGAMPIEDVLTHLTNRGCEDITYKLEIKSSSDHPVSNGGFGDVYRIILQNGRQLAFKCVRLRVGADADGRKYLERAAHELYVWSKCQHPNVMELIGVARFRGQLAVVSPWVDNGDLKWFIGRHLEVDRCALCLQIADGVTYLHGRGIVHGDLKAANILVSQERIIKITDFGNAALAEYSLQFTNNAGGCSVSPRWTAPEILEERTKTTVAEDIFALGMTILEVITGAYPYDNVKDVVVSIKIMNRVHPARPEVHIPTGSKHGDRLWSLLTRCWEYDGQDRPTALKVRNEMKKITPKELKSTSR